MVVPGLQALFGFQMMSVFNARFESLPQIDQMLHLAATMLTTVAIVLIMSPTAYHRIVEPQMGSSFFVRFASALVALAMAPLMISLSIDVFVVADLLLGDNAASVALAAPLLTLFCGFWFIYPLIQRRRCAAMRHKGE